MTAAKTKGHEQHTDKILYSTWHSPFPLLPFVYSHAGRRWGWGGGREGATQDETNYILATKICTPHSRMKRNEANH